MKRTELIKFWHGLLWPIIEDDIVKRRVEFKDHKEAFFEDFFKPDQDYSITCASDDKWEQRYADYIIELHEILMKNFKDIYDLNIDFMEWFNGIYGYGNGYRRNFERFPCEFLVDITDGFFRYVAPRVVFSSNPRKKFDDYFHLFINDFLSDEMTVLYYCRLENFHGDSFRFNLDDESKISSCGKMLPHDFDYEESVEKYCFYWEIFKRCSILASRTVDSEEVYDNHHKSDFFSYGLTVKKFKKIVAQEFNFDFYYHFRKLIFLIRIAASSITYFEIIGIRPLYQIDYNLPLQAYTGHRLKRGLFYNTEVKDWQKRTIISLWNHIKKINYESIMVPDFKYEFALKRSEVHGPIGRDDSSVFNNFDRILDLFQGIENIIAAPINGKGKYLESKLTILLNPDKTKIKDRSDDRAFIREMWKIRNDYAHGDLDQLIRKYQTYFRQRQDDLGNKTYKLAVKYGSLMEFLIKNHELIPLPGERGRRDVSKIEDYCDKST